MMFRSHGDGRTDGLKSEPFASFQLTQQLAAGELTVVDRARAAGDAWAGSLVVKRLHRKHLESDDHRQLLLASARSLLGASFANVVRVLDVRAEPEPYVVSEFIDGASLGRCLRVATPQENARYVMPILVDVLHGLHALHTWSAASAGSPFVHGAPVERHILVGLDGVARVGDCTHITASTVPWSTLHEQRLRSGEMAPEQALAPSHIDARCDVFVVGIVLWQALTGMPLFGTGDREVVLQRMLRQLIELPSETGARFASGLDQVCLRALQRTRSERYESAAEFAHCLRMEAERRGCYASKEEIGAWAARGLLSSEPRTPAAASATGPSVSPEVRLRRGAAARRNRASSQTAPATGTAPAAPEAAELRSRIASPASTADEETPLRNTWTGWPAEGPRLADIVARTSAPSADEAALLSGHPASLLDPFRPGYDEAQASIMPSARRGRLAQPVAGLAVVAAALLILFAVSTETDGGAELRAFRDAREGAHAPESAPPAGEATIAWPAAAQREPSADRSLAAPQAPPIQATRSAHPANVAPARAPLRQRARPAAKPARLARGEKVAEPVAQIEEPAPSGWIHVPAAKPVELPSIPGNPYEPSDTP